MTSTDPRVQSAAAALHSKDPCGYPVFSVEPTLAQDVPSAATLGIPVLSVFGDQNPDFIVPAAVAYQRVELATDKQASVVLLRNTPDATTLGRTHTQYRRSTPAFCVPTGSAITGARAGAARPRPER